MLRRFVDELLRHDSFVVTTHIRPDGDAIGSQLAMGQFLRAHGKDVFLLGSDDAPRNVAWLDREKSVAVFDRSPGQLIRIGQADAVVLVDANTLHRVGALEHAIESHLGTRFVIDHHPDPQPVFHNALVDPTRASTGELVFELFEHAGLDLLDESAAEALYVAIMTDTGSFRFSAVTSRVHEITARLLEIGDLSAETIYNRVYKTRTYAGQHLLGLSLSTLQLVADGRAGLMSVTRDMLERTGAHTEDAEGFTDHILAIEGVDVAVLAMQVSDHVKLSFRSHGSVPVNELAIDFGGGGHVNAAGAFVRGRMESVLRDLQSAIERMLVAYP